MLEKKKSAQTADAINNVSSLASQWLICIPEMAVNSFSNHFKNEMFQCLNEIYIGTLFLHLFGN